MEFQPDDVEDDQSPIQQSIKIHKGRIDIILTGLIEKLSIGCCIDQLREDTKLMNLREHSLLLGSSGGGGGGHSKKSSVGSSRRSISDNSRHKKQSVSQELLRDAHTSNMVAILHHSPEFMDSTNNLLEVMGPEERQFIDQMKELKEIILGILRTTASEERTYNNKMKEAYDNNEKYKIRNNELEKIHRSKMHEYSLKMKDKQNRVASFENQIQKSHSTCIEDLHRIINDSERQMSKTITTSAEHQEILDEDMKAITNKYQTLLEENLQHEKILRKKRYKVETALAGCLAKYDQDIGELQEQLEEQQDGYKAEKQAFDDLSEKSEYQVIEHEMLMTEKAEEEQKIFDKKRYLFIATRSARIIQRWWRKIYNKFFVKKKKGKGKGKKGKK